MLTKRLQVQAIADKLAGLDNNQLRLQDFESPLREVYQAVRDAQSGQEQQALTEAISKCPDGDTIMGAILRARPGNRLNFQSLHDLADRLQPIKWLWLNWIPRGMISMLGAVPGAGKSYLALDIARRIILSDSFPDGTPISISGAKVIYVDAEAIPQLGVSLELCTSLVDKRQQAVQSML